MAWSICLLEDDANFREVLLDALEDFDGYNVYPAANPRKALEIASSRTLDLVITDVRMEEMDGIQCVEKMRQNQPDLRTVVMTGYASDDAPDRAIAIEAEDYLYKPFTLKQFTTTVSRVLEAKKEQSLYQDVVLNLNVPDPNDPVQIARNKAYRAFYVGVRSGLLAQDDAYVVWNRIEEVEQPASLGDDASERYRSLLRFMSITKRAERMALLPELTGRISPQDFARFYRRVKAGEISTELLKIAVLLRKLDKVSLRGNQDLRSLYCMTWAEATLPETPPD
ncbi:MAG: response regulator [Candidatus Eremiobacterota bacterium]